MEGLDFNSSLLNENQHQQTPTVSWLIKNPSTPSTSRPLFERYSTVLFTPDTEGDLIFNGLAGTENHSLNSQGIQIDSSYILNDQHTIRFGLSATLSEQDANDPLLVFPADSAATKPTAPNHHPAGDYKAAGSTDSTSG